jgi:hypothetical protein
MCAGGVQNGALTEIASPEEIAQLNANGWLAACGL